MYQRTLACNDMNLMYQIYLKLKEVFDNQSCMGGVRTDRMLNSIVNDHQMIFDSGQDFTDDQLKALIETVRTLPLTALHLRGDQNPMRDKQFLQLLPVLTSHQHLKELCITEEELSLATCERITEEMIHLNTLGIANPFPDPKERQAFLQALANMTNLTHLDLSNNDLNDNDIHFLIQALDNKVTNLKSIDLQMNDITNKHQRSNKIQLIFTEECSDDDEDLFFLE